MDTKAEQQRFLQMLRERAEGDLRQRNYVRPLILVMGGIGRDLIALAWQYRDDAEKYAILGAAKRLARLVNAQAVGIVTEAWFLGPEAPEEEMLRTARGELAVRDSPHRREQVMVSLDLRDGGFSMHLADLQRTSPPGDDSGRFVALGRWTAMSFNVTGNLRFFEKAAQA